MSEESLKTEMLRSVKGKDMLLVGEYLFHYDDRTSKAYRWVCSRRKDKIPCRVRMYTTLIDEWDLSRHKVQNIIGEHPHGPAVPKAILRARQKKREADAKGSPCTLSNKSLKRKIEKQELDRSDKKTKFENDSDDDQNNESKFNGDTSDEELGLLVKSLGIKVQDPQEKKLLMLKTAKGHHMVAVDGCVYRLDGKSMISTTYRWKCFRSKDLQCSGKIYTECLASGLHRFKPIRLEENSHNHQPYSESKIEALIRRNNIKVLQGKDEKQKEKTKPLSAIKGGGNVLSISTNIEVGKTRQDMRRTRNEATAKLFRQVDDVMDALENPKDGEITKFTFLPSLKGNRILIMDNMIFHYDSRGSHSDRAYWTCLYRRDKVHKCNARLITEGVDKDMKIIKINGNHKHPNNHRENILKRMNQNLKVKDKSLLSQKTEIKFSDSESDDSDDYPNDNDIHENKTMNDTEFSRGSTPDISDFLVLKEPKAEKEMETLHVANEAAINENLQSPVLDYKIETVEQDPFRDTLPIIEYIEMERVNPSNYCSDSEVEQEFKPQPKKTRGRKSLRNDNNDDDDDNDEDYKPSKSQSILKKYSSKNVMASFNPDNIDITKLNKLRSAKGGELLCVDGYIYHLKSISVTTRTYWACIKSKDRVLKCPARVTTLDDNKELRVVHLSNSHTHPISENDIKKRLFNEFSKTGQKNDIKTKHIMEKSLTELNPEFAHLLGNHNIVQRDKYRFNMKLYSVSDGPPSLAVRMCLKALNVPYELHNVDYLASEHLTEDYAKINPQKEIPVLDDDGFLLSESVAIMQYLCDRYGGDGNALYPKAPKDRAIVNHRLCFNMSFYYSNIGAYSMAPIFFGYERTEMGLKKVNNALSVLETYLERLGTKYAAGPNVTIADFALVSATLCLEGISFDLCGYPRITKWYNTFKKEQQDLWAIANSGMQEIKEFEQNPPDMSQMDHPFHPPRKGVA